MLHDTTLAFIGSGTMAEAMIRGLLHRHLITPERIIASGPRPERGEELHQRYGIRWTTDNREAARAADIVVLSVKPQVLPLVLVELAGTIRPEQLVLSIVAGARIEYIARALNHEAIVRVMPNTPAQIGEGMSVWTATPAVTEAQQEQTRWLLSALGKELSVHDEDSIDMATAVSGTGPTYVFLVMEALVDAAVHLGFSRRIAQELVTQTVIGAALFARESGKHLAELRNMVTSPGGTSAEAIYQLEKGGLRTVISKAVWAAYQKSKLLGEMVGAGRPRPLSPLESPGLSNMNHTGAHR
ncbi:MAG: pyrroline-5-carboxylate reductase [Anaerolineae bacterium]|nr:pyrroline-5-carboxylate reductase [Anaerolineae bacterium]MDW8067811.1 pyrroline-5-carboxylate reductase [Anaerolineae bacterium]